MIKYYCDICGSETTPKENENELSIRLVKAGWSWGEIEDIHFCNKCGKKLNLESIKKSDYSLRRKEESG